MEIWKSFYQITLMTKLAKARLITWKGGSSGVCVAVSGGHWFSGFCDDVKQSSAVLPIVTYIVDKVEAA